MGKSGSCEDVKLESREVGKLLFTTQQLNNLTTQQKTMSEYKYPFEKLNIWDLSINLSVLIYELSNRFPAEEKFGITSQIRRSANSVSANIAEGAARVSDKEKARFFQIAYSSLMETLNFLIIANRLNFIDENQLFSTRQKIEELSNKINAYHRKLQPKSD